MSRKYNAGRRGRRPLRRGHDVSAFDAPCAGVRQRAAEGVVPYGGVRISGANANLREGQAPPLRGGAKPTRDVEDAVPYGGDGTFPQRRYPCARPAKRAADSRPYGGFVRFRLIAWFGGFVGTAGGASPSPTGGGRTWCETNTGRRGRRPLRALTEHSRVTAQKTHRVLNTGGFPAM